MPRIPILLIMVAISLAIVRVTTAERPLEKKEQAEFILTGTVEAIYSRATDGYRQFIVEIKVEYVTKGTGYKNGDTFRAFCYQRKDGKGGLEFDSRGHDAVPSEGQHIKVFVNGQRGRYEGVYPAWFDQIRDVGK